MNKHETETVSAILHTGLRVCTTSSLFKGFQMVAAKASRGRASSYAVFNRELCRVNWGHCPQKHSLGGLVGDAGMDPSRGPLKPR